MHMKICSMAERPSPTTTVAPSGRFQSLDGLRGLAAMVVVLHHGLLIVPALGNVYYGATDLRPGSLYWLATYTPLHFFWAGGEGVFMFFVLSGFVLVLPVVRDGWRTSWLTYYVRRAIRLYLPVFAVIAFALVTVTAFPRQPGGEMSKWIQARPSDLDPAGLMLDSTLVHGVSRFVSPLWSLQWEVWFSILLPLYALIAISLRRSWPLLIGVALAAICYAAYDGSRFSIYLPMFMVGCTMATQSGRLLELGARISHRRHSTAIWILLLVLAVLLFTSYWTLHPLIDSSHLQPLTRPAIVLGAALMLFLSLAWQRAVGLLSSKSFRWVGGVSFSLYLVHEPIIIATTYALRDESRFLVLAVAIPLSFAAAWVFHRCVELPSHRLARSISFPSLMTWGPPSTNSPATRHTSDLDVPAAVSRAASWARQTFVRMGNG